MNKQNDDLNIFFFLFFYLFDLVVEELLIRMISQAMATGRAAIPVSLANNANRADTRLAILNRIIDGDVDALFEESSSAVALNEKR